VVSRPPNAGAAAERALNSIGIQVSPAAFHAVAVDLSFAPETDFTWTLECGTTTAYGSSCRTGGASNGNTEPGASFIVTGLQDGTTYHFRAVASDTAHTTTWSSDDASASTPTTAPPVIDFYTYGIASGHISGYALINLKGLDTTWYLAAGADLAPPQTSVTYTLSDQEEDRDIQFWGGSTSFGLQLGDPLPSVVYLQLHAGNAKGNAESAIVTLTIPTTTTPTTSVTTTTPPPPQDETRPTMSSTVLPAGVVGKPYHVVRPSSEGSPPYTVELNGFDERMPPGLQLESNGVVDGTPTSEGAFGVNIQVFDQRYPVAVGPASIFTLTIPIMQASATTTEAATTTRTPPPKRTVVLPSRTRTPGAINRAVTQKTIRKTICVASWTRKTQPSVAYASKLRLRQMKQYGEVGNPRAYEEDHMIPIELGGAPRNPKNLWPEPRAQSKRSDPLEGTLRRNVCAGTLTLAAARKRIVTYKRTHG
jgi:hypothetical protein